VRKRENLVDTGVDRKIKINADLQEVGCRSMD
jgi:hypothetical protein